MLVSGNYQQYVGLYQFEEMLPMGPCYGCTKDSQFKFSCTMSEEALLNEWTFSNKDGGIFKKMGSIESADGNLWIDINTENEIDFSAMVLGNLLFFYLFLILKTFGPIFIQKMKLILVACGYSIF